jgi:hypothetical protein
VDFTGGCKVRNFALQSESMSSGFSRRRRRRTGDYLEIAMKERPTIRGGNLEFVMHHGRGD